MRHVVKVALCVILAAVVCHAWGGELQKGDKEIVIRGSYSDVDLGSSEGIDIGSTEETELTLSHGWLLTDSHEVGILASYIKQETDGGDLFEDSDDDGTEFGGFYAYNIQTQGNITPFFSLRASVLGGDLGDLYDLAYGVEVGLKFYPFEHGGFGVSLAYTELQSDEDFLPDADSLNLGVGLILKY